MKRVRKSIISIIYCIKTKILINILFLNIFFKFNILNKIIILLKYGKETIQPKDKRR